jgi:hypothetical protein
MWIKKEGAFEGIVPPDLFFTAQGILRARAHRFSDEELIEKLRRLVPAARLPLRPDHQRGRRDAIGGGLRAPLRQPDPRLPGGRLHAGSGLPVSGGQSVPAPPASGDRRPDRTDDRRGRRRGRARSGDRPAHRQPRVHGLAGALPLPVLDDGRRRWKVRFDTSLAPDITVAVRLDETNQAPLDYYLLPRLDFGNSRASIWPSTTASNSRATASTAWTTSTAWPSAAAFGGPHDESNTTPPNCK